MREPDVSGEHIDSTCRIEKKFRLTLPPVYAGVLLGLIYEPEDGGIYSTKRTELQIRKPQSFGDTLSVCDLPVVPYIHLPDDGHSVSETCSMTTAVET
jgi:hypothetical protein